jgi:transposase
LYGRGIHAINVVREHGMYLRHTTRRKDGKTHKYWRLVQSVRCGGKVVQKTVAQLGELDAEGRAQARMLARQITGRGEQVELFEEQPLPATVPVRLDRVRIERERSFGAVWLAWTLWRALGLDALCAELIPEGREKIPWATMAAILVSARLCEPSSELHIAEDWYRRTALDDILGVPVDRVNDDRLYRALDQLLVHKEALESHLRTRLGELFSIDYDLLLYDVTSTYFEGACEANPMAKRGYSRDHRSDCKQVCIALVVTREGLPLGYEIFDGNRIDVTTVEEIVGTMEKRFGLANRIWVMDRGMVSEKNVAWLQKTKRRFLLGASRAELAKWKKELLEKEGWQEAREGVQVRVCAGPDGTETFVLCRSHERIEKEKAIHQRFSESIEKGLKRLDNRISRSRQRLDRGQIERQIGRLLQRNARAAKRYSVRVQDEPSAPSGVRLEWSVCTDWDDWLRASEGCYVLRTNVQDWTAEELWKTYTQLTEAEAAFRIHKSDLSIRPIWHHKAGRVKAHILVCFLAYVLWKTLEQWMLRAGLGHSPRTLLEEVHRLRSVDVVLPTAEPLARELRIRCVVRPDPDQAALLDRLGLRLPERLRIPTANHQM